ncbi:hypothetical protein AL036_17905 [Salipiger aestuarii]|uniref:Uncharacterized protein n=1 Tax=Salipiger aestuarii TaxID=568098 RepID=A0A327XQA2_9RHOB|nr:hypothetical protein [Salipiger aestuarii]EIE51405.1 hypothetical protein C357_08845 [Citreicella sp. 357]KAA8605674.1 hypothetical protein AL036_17905 [Salipiger aestuarii]KAA8612837.1 hypothetical protein AL037_06855 [Salipiger aestuarii]KAB2539840.1 hypothetical protein AL035_17515 [Salipiger aestuarii]RAK10980.1 hypothetical protein ATI53_105316 [Salipiger aestuarii]
MSLATELADALAEDTFKVMEATGDDRFFMQVAEIIGASSTTLEEAYLTSVRVRMAEARARNFIMERLDTLAQDADA